jgi:hypothetical protein
VLLVSALLLPFLPGRHDPFAVTLSVAATGVAFGSLLLVPIGALWLSSARGYVPARAGVAVATLLAAGTAVMSAAVGSLAAAAIFLAACGAWLVHLWRAVRTAQSNGATLENPRTEEDQHRRRDACDDRCLSVARSASCGTGSMS